MNASEIFSIVFGGVSAILSVVGVLTSKTIKKMTCACFGCSCTTETKETAAETTEDETKVKTK